MKFSSLLVILLPLMLLQGCAAVVVAGAGTAAVSSANDRRTIGSQIDDNSIEFKASKAIGEVEALRKVTRLVVKSVNGNLLIVGQVPSESLRTMATKALSNIDGVKKVYNQIRIGNITSMSTQTVDTWITTKVKLKLLTEEDINSHNISVLTENAEVYLMGLVTKEEADKAVEVARNISGVAKVIKVFEIL